MKAPKFAYLGARTLDEVFAAFERHGEAAKLLAGGQSLVPALNMRLLEPSLLIDINRLTGLDRMEVHGDGLRIGALVRHCAVAHSPLVARLAPLVHQAMPHIAHPAIRHRGTIGGSLAHADPAAELPACAVALAAVLRIASRRGERRIAAGAFFKGLYETALAPDEVITAIDIPAAAPDRRFVFDELARRRGDYAIVGLAAAAGGGRGEVRDARLVFFGVGGAPVEARAAAARLAANPGDFRGAAAALDDDLDPPADAQADGATKLHLARVLLGRALARLAAT